MIALRQFQDEIVEWGKSMGWNDDRDFPTLIALMHSELSEALEEYRNNRELGEIYFSGEDRKPEGVLIELADVIIRILHFCGHHGFDMDEALRMKQAYNRTRKFRHGGKKI